MTAYYFVLPILFLCLSLDYAQPRRVITDQSTRLKTDQPTYPWDLLIFTQQWPATVCKEWKDKDPSHKCSLPDDPPAWTIHGIWPTKLHTIGPAFCNRTWHFDPEQVRSIETPLTKFWTNIEAGTSTYSLWSHEWSKHGTCAAVLEPLNSELKYFTTGLEWLQKFSMSKILQNANIVPCNDKEYSITDILTAVISQLHVNPAIECRKENGKSWLVEIRICFNKTLDLVDCNGILKFNPKDILYDEDETMPILTNCDHSQGVIYPHDALPPTNTKAVLEDGDNIFQIQNNCDRSQHVIYTHDTLLPPNTLYVQLYKLVSWLQWFTM